VLCKSEHVAHTIASRLHDRLAVALDEFRREKLRSQHSRTHHRRSLSLPNDMASPGGGSVRTKFLKLGQNFRPPIGHSNSAPKLGSITEGDEDSEAGDADSSQRSQSLADSEHDCDVDCDIDVFSSCSYTRCVVLYRCWTLMNAAVMMMMVNDNTVVVHFFRH